MVLNAVRHDQDGVMVHELAAFVARDRDKYARELVLSQKRLEERVAETGPAPCRGEATGQSLPSR